MTTVPPALLAKLEEGVITKTAAARELGIPRTTLNSRLETAALGPRDAEEAGDTDADHSEVTVIHRHYPDQDKLLVYPMGDAHIGAQEHIRDRWLQWLKYLGDTPDTSLLGTGDFLNCAIPGSKSDVHLEKLTLDDALATLRSDLTGLAGLEHIDLLMPGNHEARVWRATGLDVIRFIAAHHAVPFAPAAAVVVYHVGAQEYVFYVRHGTGSSGLSPGAIGNSMRRSAEVFPTADVVLQGHTHQQQVALRDHFELEGEELVQRKQYHICSGSFVGYARYAAERGWPPQHIGAPRIFLDGTRHDVHVSV